MAKPTVGQISLPKDEVIKLLLERKASITNDIHQAELAYKTEQQYEEQVKDWEDRVMNAVLKQLVPVTITGAINKSNKYTYGYSYGSSNETVKVVISADNIEDVIRIVGNRPVPNEYVSPYTLDKWKQSIVEIDSYIKLLSLSVDLEVKLRTTDKIAQFLI